MTSFSWALKIKKLSRCNGVKSVYYHVFHRFLLLYAHHKLRQLTPYNPFSDQHHFDNPVYAYQSVSKSQPNLLENGNLNNGVTIKNNLSLKDDTNREWEKLGTFTFHDDACSLGM